MIVLSLRLAMILLFFLALSPHLVFSYNVDTASPIIYEDPDRDSNRPNYFGYSLSLSWTGKTSSAPSLFVGAPESSNGTGSVYRCNGFPTGDQQTPQCHLLEIEIDRKEKLGWLGASMAAAPGADFEFTVCAPLSIHTHRLNSSISAQRILFNDISGACYYARGAEGDVLHRVNANAGIRDHNLVERGFSINYYAPKSLQPSNQRSVNAIRVIGLPGLGGVEFKHDSGEGVWTSYKRLWSPQIGYSVSVGYFRGKNEYYVAAGAPSASHKGMVKISSPWTYAHDRIDGKYLGEYFGASLATGDFDNDGHDDLAIGAPHWGDGDFGRVYTYRFDRNGKTTGKVRILQGNANKGQFGYTLASADLDADGFADLVVSAPWENAGAGAVYIYYGHRDFNKESPPAHIIQRIDPSALGRHGGIQRFGFGLSQPVDIDGNGYPDLAIGAYKSGHAVVLRSRLVIKTAIDLVTYPETLQGSPKDFIVSVCVTYEGKWAPEFLDLSFDMTVDAKHNRAGEKTFTKLNVSFRHQNRACVNTTIPLTMKPGSSALDPIKIKVTHSFEKDVHKRGIDPVLNRTSTDTKELTLYFETGCEGGRVCNAQLFVDATLGGIRENNSWVVGSGDVSLNIVVRNEKEPAYVTRITIGIPPGIHLRKTLEFCSIAMDALSLTCDIANPLVQEEPKALDIEFDMSEIDLKSIGVAVLTFNVTKSTRSNDEEADNSTTILTLNTKHDATVNLEGVTGKQHYPRTSKDTEILIQHAYQVHKSGPSPLTEAYLSVDVPTSMPGTNVTFMNITDAKLIDDSGYTHNCDFTGSGSRDDLLQRNRRDNSAGTDGTPESDDELPNNTPEENMTVLNQVTERTINLNCSTKGVSCTRLNCSFEFSNAPQGVGNMVLNMKFNATSIHTSGEDAFSYAIHTNASVDIKWPLISDPDHIRIWTANATTILHNIPEPKKPALWWILPASIVCGILLFAILAGILYKTGFFRRSSKLEDAKAKEKLILESNKADLDDVDLDGDEDKDEDATTDVNGHRFG